MKKILCMCIGVLFSSANIMAAISAEQEAKCLNAMAIAQATMSVRQKGLPLIEALQNLDKMYESKEISQKEYDLAKMILRDAYSKPKFSTKKYQDDSINEYSAKYYLACMEALDISNN